jgi:hypothetical protein
MRFEGTASSTAADREGERMTVAALEAMARGGSVELRDGHRGETIGVVEECRREGQRLRVSGRLEPSSPRARALWDKLRAGVRLALSVGGRKRVVMRYSPVAGRRVRMIEQASLEHVAVCHPAEARNAETEVVASRETRVASGGGEVARRETRDASGGGEVARRETRDAGREPAAAAPLPSPSPPVAGGDSARSAQGWASPEPEPAEPGRRRSLPVQTTGRTQASGLPLTNDELWKGVL